MIWNRRRDGSPAGRGPSRLVVRRDDGPIYAGIAPRAFPQPDRTNLILAAPGFRNEDLTQIIRGTFDDIIGSDLGAFIQDRIVTIALNSGTLRARALLGGQKMSAEQLRSHLELAGIGLGTAVTVDALLSML